MPVESTAFGALQILAKKSLAHAHQLPAQIEAVQQWSGIGFALLGHRFVMPMNELTEILEVPSYTRLPGVYHWVKGVANVRGRLLPLFDLAAFFAGSLTSQKKHQRLLVIEQNTVYAGLWVDRSFGMHHFDVDSKTQDMSETLPDAIAEFTDGVYEHEGHQWIVFSTRKFSQSRDFLDVAVA